MWSLSMPDLEIENSQAFVRPPAMVMLLLTLGARWRPFSRLVGAHVVCGLRGASGALSLGGVGYLSTFEGVAVI